MPIVEPIVRQHADDAAVLAAIRSALVSAPGVKLRQLARCDHRVAAHLDGLAVAGEDAWPFCEAGLETPSYGTVFTAAVRAVSAKQGDRLDRLFALVAAQPEIQSGLLSAFGWLEAQELRGWVAELLASADALRRLVGIAACAMHRVDPGLTSALHIEDPDSVVRARAWRTAGELGKHELVSTAAAAISDNDPGCQFWAAWSAVLLGEKRSALESLRGVASTSGPLRSRALRLALLAAEVAGARELLGRMAPDPANRRLLICGAGLAGDPAYIPWLIDLIANERLARVAGEAFSLITGVDLAALDLERKPPENLESGPNDEPNDPNVDMDEDDGLPWPEQARVQAWWNANQQRFQAGTRYFMGEPLNRENCMRVLREGYQRQRSTAALYLSLLDPGTPLFEWRAPAWRQQRLLAPS